MDVMHGSETDQLLTVEDVAGFIKRSVGSLNKDRLKSTGPPFVKLGRLVRYRKSALIEWLEQREQKGA